MKNIVILISGHGSNMAAIVDAARSGRWESVLGARIAAVVSNRPQAAGLQWAREQGLATALVDHKAYAGRGDFEAALAEAIDAFKPELLVLAGFMRVLGAAFVARFAGRMINIHPSLLPAFAGLQTHQRAIDAGCRVAGATVHWVSESVDGGAIIDQGVVPILAGDSAHDLAQRVLALEHQLYPRAIANVLRAN